MQRVASTDTQPNELERAIIERIGEHEPWLQASFAELQVIERKYTGAGSYTTFACELPESPDDPYPGLKPLIRIPSFPDGLGAVLWCRRTRPQCLEIFTYGDAAWDGTYEGFTFD